MLAIVEVYRFLRSFAVRNAHVYGREVTSAMTKLIWMKLSTSPFFCKEVICSLCCLRVTLVSWLSNKGSNDSALLVDDRSICAEVVLDQKGWQGGWFNSLAIPGY